MHNSSVTLILNKCTVLFLKRALNTASYLSASYYSSQGFCAVILPWVWWSAHISEVYGWSRRRQSKPWWPFSSTPSFVSFQFWLLWALLSLPGHALWAGAPPICPEENITHLCLQIHDIIFTHLHTITIILTHNIFFCPKAGNLHCGMQLDTTVEKGLPMSRYLQPSLSSSVWSCWRGP